MWAVRRRFAFTTCSCFVYRVVSYMQGEPVVFLLGVSVLRLALKCTVQLAQIIVASIAWQLHVQSHSLHTHARVR